jgi:hypothetical protein
MKPDSGSSPASQCQLQVCDSARRLAAGHTSPASALPATTP